MGAFLFGFIRGFILFLCGYGLGKPPVDPYPHGNLWCGYELGVHGGGMTATPSLHSDGKTPAFVAGVLLIVSGWPRLGGLSRCVCRQFLAAGADFGQGF